MFSALYYPHTTLSTSDIASQRLLKRALLMWDRLEFIVPDSQFTAHYDDPLVAEAIELIGENRCPNDEEKNEAHNQIEELVTRPHLPEVFYYTGSDVYEMYPQKLLPKTWELLEDAGYAASMRGSVGRDGEMSNPFGHAVMAILADCCAGTTRSRVTDRGQAYASLAGLIADESSTQLRDDVVDLALRASPSQESLLSLKLSLPDVDNLSLGKLVEFRRREAAEASYDFQKLRHKFVDRINEQVQKLLNPQRTESDVTELKDQFFEENANDFAVLRDELELQLKDVATDLVVAVVAGSSVVAASLYPALAPVLKGVATAVGGPITINRGISIANKFFKSREEILRKHPMALLHELQTN